MTCTTFLHDGELNQPLPDGEVQAILDEVRKLSGENWQVVPLPSQRAGLFRRKQPDLYGVYVYVGGIGPWQQINFWSADRSWSISLYQPLEVVAAYLLGMLGGLHKAKRIAKNPTPSQPTGANQ
jgi:hypothetical protein